MSGHRTTPPEPSGSLTHAAHCGVHTGSIACTCGSVLDDPANAQGRGNDSLFAPQVDRDFIRFDEATRWFLSSRGFGNAGMATSRSWLCPVCNYPGNAHDKRCFVAMLVCEIGKAATVGEGVSEVERLMIETAGNFENHGHER